MPRGYFTGLDVCPNDAERLFRGLGRLSNRCREAISRAWRSVQGRREAISRAWRSVQGRREAIGHPWTSVQGAAGGRLRAWTFVQARREAIEHPIARNSTQVTSSRVRSRSSRYRGRSRRELAVSRPEPPHLAPHQPWSGWRRASTSCRSEDRPPTSPSCAPLGRCVLIARRSASWR